MVNESTRAAIERYDAKTYKQVNIKLRVEDDADIIKELEECTKQKIPMREWLRELFDNQK